MDTYQQMLNMYTAVLSRINACEEALHNHIEWHKGQPAQVLPPSVMEELSDYNPDTQIIKWNIDAVRDLNNRVNELEAAKPRS